MRPTVLPDCYSFVSEICSRQQVGDVYERAGSSLIADRFAYAFPRRDRCATSSLNGRLMPHIKLPENLQGIRGPMAFRPETARPLNELAEILLHAPNSLPQADRELIATYVSSLNDCYF